ncbi:MAG: hypothetical protein WD845_05885 [Pirellulales bacterium]
MKFQMLLVVALVTVVSLASLRAVPAQGLAGGSTRNPNGPTVSPYLNLLQNNNPDITNYQSLVKPLINQNDALRRQGGAIQQLQQQQYRGGPAGGGTGVHSYFMYYSHYFPQGR